MAIERKSVKRHAIGSTEVEVSQLAFGGAGIGSQHRPVGEDEAAAAVAEAWDCGVRYFDTAPLYGAGLGERRLGAALARHPRNEFTISTKIGRLVVDGGLENDFSRDGVLRSLEESRVRTGLDRFDIVFVHDPEDHLAEAIDEALPALVDLRDQGEIGAVGVGTNYVETARHFLAESDVDAIMLAGRWTLVDRSGEDVVDECRRRGISVLDAAPFNSGLLAQPFPPDDATFTYRPASAEMLALARACAQICERHGSELPAAALQFPLRHAAVAGVVAGVCDAVEARAAVERFHATVPAEAWAELDTAVTTREA